MPTTTATPTSASAPLTSRVFNDDLLINQGDLQYAQTQFPEIFPALDHKELRDTFAKYELAANEARSSVRRLGMLAVVSGTVALLSAATEPLWHGVAYEKVLSIGFELCFMAAAVIAGGSLLLGPWRERWLEARFMTERLRQWQFQLLVRKGGEIEALLASPNPAGQQAFEASRKRWFAEFLQEHEGKLEAQFTLLAKDPDDFSSDWLLNPPTPYSATSASLPHVFEAYHRLRFKHQLNYAAHKLSDSKDKPLWEFLKWPVVRQEAAIRGVVSTCFFLALGCSAAVILNGYFDFKPHYAPLLGSATLVIAVVGVAFRTIQEGLGISKDIERYRDYRGKVRRLMFYFENTTDQQKRLDLMEEMELVVVDELRGFLRTHSEAAFLL